MSCFEHPEAIQVLVGMSLLVLTMLVPLIPAVIVFKLFPDTRVAASGPLSGLKVRTSGAFAAYLIVLVLATAMSKHTEDSIATMSSPSWLIEGKVVVKTPDGKVVEDESAYTGLQITMDPRHYGGGGKTFWARVPEIDKRIPTISLSMPTVGQQTIEPQQLPKNRGSRRIVLEEPVVIQQIRTDAPYEPPAAPLVVGAAPLHP